MDNIYANHEHFLKRVARRAHERRIEEVSQTDWYKDVCLKCEHREMEMEGKKCYCVVLHWGMGRCMKVAQYLKDKKK